MIRKVDEEILSIKKNINEDSSISLEDGYCICSEYSRDRNMRIYAEKYLIGNFHMPETNIINGQEQEDIEGVFRIIEKAFK